MVQTDGVTTSPTPSQSAPRTAPTPPPGQPAARSRPGDGGPGGAVGRVIEVTVSAIADDEVEVKLADGRIGVIQRSEFEGQPPAVGTVIPAAVLAREDRLKRVTLSHSWARKLLVWERIERAKESGEALTGKVVRTIKGGLLVDLGLRAFLPNSMIGEQGPNDPEAQHPENLVGQEITVFVTETNRALDRIVVSRRDYLRRRRRQIEREVFGRVKVGDRIRGRVIGIVDYGAYVDVDGVRALLHRSELSWGRVSKVTDVVNVGDEIDALVIEVQKSKRRIGLSLRRLQPDPFDELTVGEVRDATITRVVDYGAFAQLAGTELIGLIHMSELSELPGLRPDELVTPGEAVRVRILSLDPDKRRIALSVRQATVI